MTTLNTKLRANDARNRALRTFLQGLAFTVAAAVVVSLLSAVTTAASWGEFGGILVGFAFFQSVAVSALSWLMRAVLDPSSVPTPLPPSDPGEPDETADVDEHGPGTPLSDLPPTTWPPGGARDYSAGDPSRH